MKTYLIPIAAVALITAVLAGIHHIIESMPKLVHEEQQAAGEAIVKVSCVKPDYCHQNVYNEATGLFEYKYGFFPKCKGERLVRASRTKIIRTYDDDSKKISYADLTQEVLGNCE